MSTVGPEPQSDPNIGVATRLRALADEVQEGSVTLHQIAQAHGAAAHGALLVLLSVPCMIPIPGTGTLLSLGIAAMAFMIWRGESSLRLPDRVGQFALSGRSAKKTLEALVWVYRSAGRLCRERWCTLVHERHRVWLAPVVALMALVIFLPIPFGNVLPAVALICLGLAQMFRDGVLLVASLSLAVAAVLLPVVLAVLTVDVAMWLMRAIATP